MMMPMSVLAQSKLRTGSKVPRLELKPEKIRCGIKEYDGLRGTLYVPEDRARPDSRTVELPVVVVKSLSPNPDYPVFQFTGGPGLSNIAPEEHINEADLKNHDIVEVGYRGVDGTPTLQHPVLDRILSTPNLLSQTSLKKIGKNLTQAVRELKAAGIDVAEYNILNVVDDMEAAREALNYEKINITGGSYGGAVVMVYCLRHPERIHRAIMIEAAFPYNIAFGIPEEFDARLNHLNALWKKDPEAVKRSPDIVQTMRNVLKNVPREHNGMCIDLSKVKFMTYFGITFQRSYVNMIFDAYVCAEKGDFTSFALMSLMYDKYMGQLGNVGDLLGKTFSSVTDPDRDFVRELQNPASVVGSPLSMLAWGSFQYCDWPTKSLVKEHPPSQKTSVETLVFYGSKETGAPFRKKYSDNFTNAHWVLLDDLGHNDIWTITAEGTQHLMQRFLDEGVVDTSKFDRIPEWEFTPQVTFAQMFQQMMQQSQKTAALK
jgi:pimeloyl-ACP methyl ester carboxylesterase